jgi:hypothetical protein
VVQNVRQIIKEPDWFLHDGAPAHFSRNVREILDNQYPQPWIGRAGQHHWPARSPDLNPLDFFLWGYLKSIIFYRRLINSEADLIVRIQEVFVSVTEEMITNATTRSLLRRAQLCIQMNGSHFEHLL